jgi:transposase
MQNNAITVGIDVSKMKLDVAVRLANGKLRTKVVSNNPEGFEQLSGWLARQAISEAHVCMEATGIYWERIAEYLSDKGFVVSVVNPAQIKAFAQSRLARTKTDRVDARLIAEFCATQSPQPWCPPSAELRELRALVLRREALVRMRAQEHNRLAVAREGVKENILAHIDHLNQSIKELEDQMHKLIDNHPHLRQQRDLLQSIPALGKISISAILAFFGGEPLRFHKARQAVAFAGLDPKEHSSGSSVQRKPRLSKMGHSLARRILYMPAMIALYRTGWGRAFRQRLEAAHKPPKVIIAAMMRKLIHVAIGVLKSARPFNPALHYQAAYTP